MNPAWEISGEYLDSSNVFHAFLRSLNGKITTFDAPGVGTGYNQGTQPQDINPAGVITGYFVDGNGAYHAFLYR
jgi:hypothetical protein